MKARAVLYFFRCVRTPRCDVSIHLARHVYGLEDGRAVAVSTEGVTTVYSDLQRLCAAYHINLEATRLKYAETIDTEIEIPEDAQVVTSDPTDLEAAAQLAASFAAIVAPFGETEWIDIYGGMTLTVSPSLVESFQITVRRKDGRYKASIDLAVRCDGGDSPTEALEGAVHTARQAFASSAWVDDGKLLTRLQRFTVLRERLESMAHLARNGTPPEFFEMYTDGPVGTTTKLARFVAETWSLSLSWGGIDFVELYRELDGVGRAELLAYVKECIQ